MPEGARSKAGPGKGKFGVSQPVPRGASSAEHSRFPNPTLHPLPELIWPSLS